MKLNKRKKKEFYLDIFLVTGMKEFPKPPDEDTESDIEEYIFPEKEYTAEGLIELGEDIKQRILKYGDQFRIETTSIIMLYVLNNIIQELFLSGKIERKEVCASHIYYNPVGNPENILDRKNMWINEQPLGQFSDKLQDKLNKISNKYRNKIRN